MTLRCKERVVLKFQESLLLHRSSEKGFLTGEGGLAGFLGKVLVSRLVSTDLSEGWGQDFTLLS